MSPERGSADPNLSTYCVNLKPWDPFPNHIVEVENQHPTLSSDALEYSVMHIMIHIYAHICKHISTYKQETETLKKTKQKYDLQKTQVRFTR